MRLGGRGDALALVEARTGTRVTYDELRERVAREAEVLRERGGLVMAFAANELSSVVTLYAAFAAGVPIALFDRLPDAPARALIERYRPEVIRGHVYSAPSGASRVTPHPSLALVLSTSGTLGSPKCVRLARTAVESNALGIAAALTIETDAVAITALPIAYAFGLSVITSHLAAGASVVLTDDGLLDAGFWQACRDHGVTSLAGVPHSFQLLERLDVAARAPRSLATFTQAGGRLAPAAIERFHQLARTRGGGFWVMYGQTEATARISVLPADALPAHMGSVGRAIPGGHLEIVHGEVVYRGPNVMMGYAQTREDLTRGDELGGVLATGDLGELDVAGWLRLTGRARRIAKLFGHRLNLDELEAIASDASRHAAAVVASDDHVRVWVETDDSDVLALTRRALVEATRLHGSGFEVTGQPTLPRLASGKLDHSALEGER